MAVTAETIAVALVGLCGGPLLERACRRLPFERSMWWPPRRHDPRTFRPEPWWGSLPVLGPLAMLALAGTDKGLRLREILLSVLAAAAGVGCWTLFVQQQAIGTPRGYEILSSYDRPRFFAMFAYYWTMTLFLLAATFIDLEHYLIPDSVTVPGMVVGVLLGTFWYIEIHPLPPYPVTWDTNPGLLLDGERWSRWFGKVPPWLEAFRLWFAPVYASHWNRIVGFATCLTGFVVGGGLVWTVRVVCGAVLGKEALGFGDVTLMAMAGIYLGWQMVVIAFFLAPASAIAVALATLVLRRRVYVAYGPHLALACVACVFLWDPLWDRFGIFFDQGAGFLLVQAVVLVVLLVVSCGIVVFFKRLFLNVRRAR